MVQRLVGFLEYSNAISELELLIKSSSKKELEAMDELVMEHDEYTVYSDLADKKYRRQKESEGTDDEPSKSARRGLRWVIALARVELGSMLAAFTNTPRPFEAVRPTKFAAEQFEELLLDGVRAHVQALENDPGLKQVFRTGVSPTNNRGLSYSRRLVLVRAMSRAAMNDTLAELTPQQERNLGKTKRRLDEVQAGLIAMIQESLGTYRTTSMTSYSDSFVGACGSLLRAESRELEAGTATRTRINETERTRSSSSSTSRPRTRSAGR